jgi:hypothetical protein
MDPTKTLEEILILAKRIVERQDKETLPQDIIAAEAHELAERVMSLNLWIARGGCFPKQWDVTDYGVGSIPADFV